MTITTAPAVDVATILASVLRSTHPKLALPTIASNHDLSLRDLQHLLNRHGYPDKARMRDAWRRAVAAQDHHLDAGVDAPAERPASDGSPRRDPYVAALPVAALFADPLYQRELDERRVQKMATSYDPALVGILEVSRRTDDQYAILDGQHRWAAYRDHAFDTSESPHVACRVHTGLTVAEEADLYHRLNTTRKQLTGWDRWLARRGAGDSQVTAIEATLAEHNLTVGPGAGGNVFRATRSAELVVDLGGTALLTTVVGIIRAAWPDDQAGLDGAIVHGLGHVLNLYSRDELDTARLTTVLAGHMPRQLTARASAARELHTGTMDRLSAHVIIDRYNASKGPRVEPFFTRIKPVSKTPTAKARAEAEYRTNALAWAKESGWSGRTDRLGPALRKAYDEHLTGAA